MKTTLPLQDFMWQASLHLDVFSVFTLVKLIHLSWGRTFQVSFFGSDKSKLFGVSLRNGGWLNSYPIQFRSVRYREGGTPNMYIYVQHTYRIYIICCVEGSELHLKFEGVSKFGTLKFIAQRCSKGLALADFWYPSLFCTIPFFHSQKEMAVRGWLLIPNGLSNIKYTSHGLFSSQALFRTYAYAPLEGLMQSVHEWASVDLCDSWHFLSIFLVLKLPQIRILLFNWSTAVSAALH